MSGSAKTEGFVDITQHDNGIKYFLSYLLQVKSKKRRFGMYYEITFLRQSLDRILSTVVVYCGFHNCILTYLMI